MQRWFLSRCLRWDRKVQAIAAGLSLVVLGIVLKAAPQSQAEMVDTSVAEQPKTQATTTARLLQRQEQTRQIRPQNFDLTVFPIQPQFERHWRHLLWTTAVVEPREPFVAESVNQILLLTTQRGLTPVQTRIVDMAMKVGTQLYLSDPSFYSVIGQRFLETIEQSSDPEWVAVALSALAKGKMTVTELQRLGTLIKTRFPNWSRNVFLQTTLQEIADASEAQVIPPLKDLLAWQVAPNQLHLYVLCRPDRRVLCRAVLKDPDGSFVRQDGGLWSVPLLLESIHSLGWNFTRGQTPQGIFRIEGTVPQPDDEFFRAYGQFPLVNLYVPFEAGAKQFLPARSGSFSGSLEDYKALLPVSWREYRPIQQSFWAGKAGRGLFRIHGSGESTDFFSGKDKNYPDSYNWNPTIGCLSAKEIYSDQGKLLQSDMPVILNALQRVGGERFTGYLVVIDVPTDESGPVSLDLIQGAIARRPLQPSSRSASLRTKSDGGMGASAPAKTAPTPEMATRSDASNSNVLKPIPIAY